MGQNARGSSSFPCDSGPEHARFTGHASACGRFDVLATARRVRDPRLSRRAERRAERQCPHQVRQSVARYAARFLRPSVSECVPAGLALGRGRLRGGPSPLSAHEGPRFRVRANHPGVARRAGLSVRARLDDRALAFAARAHAGRFHGRHDFLEGSALDVASATGQAGPAIRLRAVVSESGRVRQVRLGRPSAVSGRRVLRRVREL